MTLRHKQPIEDLNWALSEYFGFKEFRPNQLETIVSILEGNNTLAVTHTGSGKSLCYQLPARILRPQLTIVVSPLVSLMDDQVDKSESKKFRAESLHSSKPLDERRRVAKEVVDGFVDVLYTSPERFATRGFIELTKHRDVGLLVVDEAHCASVWGHDFRPSYLFIPGIRETLGNPQIAMFTATAPPYTREDMLKALRVENPHIIQGDIVPKNIQFTTEYPRNKLEDLVKILSAESSGSIIVYCSTVKDVENLHDTLSKQFPVLKYHGQMDPNQKRQNQDKFMRGESRMIICTNAFGMGIDKPDVYTIVHYSIPGSLEQYIQEAGRAGRDGNPAKAILLYDYDDIKVQHSFIARSNPNSRVINYAYDLLFKNARMILEHQKTSPTYSQLVRVISNQGREEWLQQQLMSAFGTLVNFGFVQLNGDIVAFPHGPDISTKIPTALLREKEHHDYQRLEVMELYAQSRGRHTQIIQGYFLGTESELVVAHENLTDIKWNKILGFLGNYREPVRRASNILTGQEEINGNYGDYAKCLPFLSSATVSETLDELVFMSLAKRVKVGHHTFYTLTRDGANHLRSNDINIKPQPPLENDIYDYRNAEVISQAMDVWKQRASHNRTGTQWYREYESFQGWKFKIAGKEYTGKELLELHSGSPSYSSFQSFVEFFFGMTVPKPDQLYGRSFRPGRGRYKR
ncbi:MAG: ATP-dependent DNA helicase RecQ [Candidatus Aenigmarchaeota archaeon]|nr:ATP-dependent DNA helicase RecQ [Candidatus Aenigmarchaeota archaeon]